MKTVREEVINESWIYMKIFKVSVLMHEEDYATAYMSNTKPTTLYLMHGVT